LEDVQFAVDSLPASYSAANKGRVTKGAALTLKAKVQMTLIQNPPAGWQETITWNEAVTTLEALTKSPFAYSLETDYIKCFDPTNKNGKESVFEVQFGETVNDNNGLVFSWFPLGESAWKDHFGADAPGEGNGTQWNIPTLDLLNAYEPGDPRLDVSVDTVFAGTPDAVIFIDKWMKYSVDTKETPTRNPCNMPIYRFADVKLMLAEAYLRAGETGKAQTQLDDVRNRAFAPGTPPAVTVSEDAIAKERRVELAFEGHRWFDLLRTDKAQAVMAAYGGIERSDPTNAKRKEPQYKIPAAAFEVDDYELRYPVPYYEWIKNPSITTQNPGWQ
ncbi:MAG: RagB/SusD family nutrient uptake outer membrane protein, partial [Prevotellaceae bacterium]|nr:RagB/SusD family nutrient uptake outer membrane protein [Prevotellaceae bacterium]